MSQNISGLDHQQDKFPAMKYGSIIILWAGFSSGMGKVDRVNKYMDEAVYKAIL